MAFKKSPPKNNRSSQISIKSMGGWDDDEFSAQETCETASATGGGADTIKFKWDTDPCQGESVTKCRSIYFRYISLTCFEILAH